MNDVIDELHRRGLIAQSTDEAALRAHLAEGPVAYYAGFDPTAPSLHVGHLLQFMVLRALQRAGHQPVVLVGGATGLIGDPRPSAERQLNERDTVAEWVRRIREQVAPFLDVPAEAEGLKGPIYVDNLEWTAPVSAIDFLRDLGKHFRVSQMLAKEAVSARLNSEAGISYTEFSYQILQANDYRELHRRHGVTLQTGGSDQWGNLTAGIDLVRRTEGARVHALSTPLVTKSDGTKFGKSEGGAVWLDPSLTSPYAFFQFWLNADDADARAWLPLYSERRPRRWRLSSRRATNGPPRGRPSARWQRSSPSSCTARSSWRRPRRPGARSSAGTTWRRWGRRRSPPRCGRRAASPWTARCRPSPSCSSSPAWSAVSRRPGGR
ncbi:tyrosine--tRNA ligase [Blastococcus sp. PRF04-17]|uniref:tyrosine--tRNA ligase n=1 Tax=Blastococcus sp. PRF04-17 TaxID=2933797 RepID=UPI001FF36301|nr:tyrosine--tRNA ligase [Blastococcus sp. PRF04-17]UOY02663.1 tyrosine--tRNA ligase [Blastococcus sp. PRF04-17]